MCDGLVIEWSINGGGGRRGKSNLGASSARAGQKEKKKDFLSSLISEVTDGWLASSSSHLILRAGKKGGPLPLESWHFPAAPLCGTNCIGTVEMAERGREGDGCVTRWSSPFSLCGDGSVFLASTVDVRVRHVSFFLSAYLWGGGGYFAKLHFVK